MSRFRREKPSEEWEEWTSKHVTMPEPHLHVPESESPRRSLHGWSQLGSLGSLNTDYGLTPSDERPSSQRSPGSSHTIARQTSNVDVAAQYDPSSVDAFWAFPESEITSSPPSTSRELDLPSLQHTMSNNSNQSASSYHWDSHNESDDDRGSAASYSTAPVTQQIYRDGDEMDKQLSALQLQQEGIERFQEGDLPDEDEEWYKLTLDSAREALDKKEVQRQSAIFEVVKSEKDYLLDLQMVEQIFVQPLLDANPPIISPPEELHAFVKEVFSNMSDIEKIHERLLASLFRRQMREHPIVTSIADVVLDASLSFREQYETYIKHYPIAEGRHRVELKGNPLYAAFIEHCAHDTRIRKRNLITLLSRPVTRLPRLSLMLEHIMKLTPEGHQDLNTIPIILNVLSQFLKSTQPGIAAAEAKVKLRSLIESVVFERGEVVDLDPSNENRSMVYTGTLARHDVRGWDLDRHGWIDITVSLLDHYLVMTRPEVRAGITRYVVMSRPIPLEFLRIDSFSLPTESRKIDDSDEPSSPGKKSRFGLGKLFRDSVSVYPFMIHHASLHSKRRYTLFAKSEAERKRWKEAIEEALFLRKTQQETNRLFVLEPISDSSFRSLSASVPSNSPLRRTPYAVTGKTVSAARGTVGGRAYVIVGCANGIYVCHSGQSPVFKRVLNMPDPPAMALIESLSQLVVLHEGLLRSFDFSAIVIAMEANKMIPVSAGKRLDTSDGNVTLMVAGKLSGRFVVCFSVKSFRQQMVTVVEPYGGTIEMPPSPITPIATRRDVVSWRRYGSPFYVPRDASSLMLLNRTIAVAVGHTLVVVNPTLSASERKVTTVPDFAACSSNASAALADLKTRTLAATPLGVVWSGETERLVIFDTFGTYVSKYGYPTRSRTYVRWETKVHSWALRPPYVLLVSVGWIEVRHVPTGRLEQVEEALDLRMLQVAEPNNGGLLLAMRGQDSAQGLSDKLVEVLETRAIGPSGSPTDSLRGEQWREWDI